MSNETRILNAIVALLEPAGVIPRPSICPVWRTEDGNDVSVVTLTRALSDFLFLVKEEEGWVLVFEEATGTWYKLNCGVGYEDSPLASYVVDLLEIEGPIIEQASPGVIRDWDEVWDQARYLDGVAGQ